jgi:GR25 family glycosyltransferase involved in LPS biosynthesis
MDSENATAIKPTTETDTPHRTGWSGIDAIYCISLIHREDRRQEASRQFAAVGLAGKVNYHLVEKHPTDSEQGIYESHWQCMAKGLKSAAETICIFEDDVIFEGFSAERLDEITDFLTTNTDWQILFLGCMVRKSERTVNGSVAKIGYRSLTHGYIINRRFAQTMMDQYPWHHVAFDDFLKNLKSSQMYAAYPMFAFQSDATSDNDPYLHLDRFRRLCGGLRNLQKRNEMYHRYKWRIICGHILALLGLVSWLWLS